MASASEPVGAGGRDEPEPRVALRGLAAYAAVLIGGALFALGWYGISGTSVVAQQLPYLASASLPGLALVISGAVLVSGDRSRRSNDRAAEMVTTLYRLLTEAVENPADEPGTESANDPTAPPTRDATLVALADSSRVHRRDCALVRGKPDATTVDPTEIESRGLTPCPICEPVIAG